MKKQQKKQDILYELGKKIEHIANESKGFQENLNQSLTKGRLSKEEEEYLEANTENVLVKPFIEIFGYNTQSLTDPNRAVAQYKVNNRRVDLALFKENEISIIIECKGFDFNLNNKSYINQLSEYFNNINPAPKFGILTNGLLYKFYASFDNENRMDDNICFEFDIRTDIKHIQKLEKLYEILYNINEEEARIEKSYARTREFVETEIINNQSEQFIRKGILETARELGKDLHDGKVINSKDIANITPVVKKVFEDIIKEKVRQGLIQALDDNNKIEEFPLSPKNKIEFTEQEKEALFIIRAIASELIEDVNRITEDDHTKHCNIILDNQARNKKICVLFFNDPKKLSVSINDIDYILTNPADIYKHKEEIKKVISTLI